MFIQRDLVQLKWSGSGNVDLIIAGIFSYENTICGILITIPPSAIRRF